MPKRTGFARVARHLLNTHLKDKEFTPEQFRKLFLANSSISFASKSVYSFLNAAVGRGELIRSTYGRYRYTPSKNDEPKQYASKEERRISYAEIGRGIAEHIRSLKATIAERDEQLLRAQQVLEDLQSRYNELKLKQHNNTNGSVSYKELGLSIGA